MTIEERNTKLKHFITCLKCEVSGKVCDDNCFVQYEAGNMGEIIENLEAISKALDQEPCDNAISRQTVDTLVDELARAISDERCGTPRGRSAATIMQDILDLPPVTPQPKTGHWKDFALWVANEIFDENWEYNKEGFAEIACRKLAKLGIVRAKGDEWELVDPQESEDKTE